MNVAVHPTEAADRGEAFPRVLANDHRAVGLENAVRIFRIDDQIGEIKRTPDHPLTLVALVPGAAAIIGNEERAVG